MRLWVIAAIVAAGLSTVAQAKQAQEIEGTGLLARALCHEIDHLNGLLYIDRLHGLKRELTWRKIERRAG